MALVQPSGPADRLTVTSEFTVENLALTALELPSASEWLWMPPSETSAERLAPTLFLPPSFTNPGQ